MAQTQRFDLADAEWLAHRHVEGSDAVRFRHVPRARHAAAPFLTDTCLGEDDATVDLDVAAALRDVAPGPLHFVFHSAFCGSTMLARAFDMPGVSMGLSEPVILNDVVGFRRRGAPPSGVARLADAATRLLARPFGASEAVIVKPSNIVNPLAELLMALRPDARAVFLHAPLEAFLISVVRKGLACRLWVRELAEGYLIEQYLAPLGITANDLLRQSDLQVAAVGWLAQHARFAALAGKLGPERLRTLDVDRLTSDPAGTIGAVAAHFGLAPGADRIAAVASGPAFSRHSKSGEAYSADVRAGDYAAARAAHGEEIGQVLAWAEAVAANAGIAMQTRDPL